MFHDKLLRTAWFCGHSAFERIAYVMLPIEHGLTYGRTVSN